MSEAFGRYTLLRRVAVGGMAEIFLADLHSDAGFAKRVVLKRILPHLNQDPEFVKMFIDEAMIAARLSHPNIIQVHDFGCVLGSYFIAMEHVDGVDLNELLQRHKAHNQALCPIKVAAIGERVARGLFYTHNLHDEEGLPSGLVHRDVSPHNIMVTRQGDVKVMDFGIAKAAARASRTTTGTIKGKLAYMAPEQASGFGATAKSDQFSLGIVLWECLSGQRLFTAETEVSLIRRVQKCDVPKLTDFRSDVPDTLDAIIQRALARDPQDRFESLFAMNEALMDFRFSLGKRGIVHLESLVEAFPPRSTDSQSWSYQGPYLGGTRRIAREGDSNADDTPTSQASRASYGTRVAAQTPLPLGVHLGGQRHRKFRLWQRSTRASHTRLPSSGSTQAKLVLSPRMKFLLALVSTIFAGIVGCALGALKTR